MAPKRKVERGATTPSSRAASLLAKARSIAAGAPATSAAAAAPDCHEQERSASALPGFSTARDEDPTTSLPSTYIAAPEKRQPIPLLSLLKQLSSRGLTMREALPVAGKLIKGGYAFPDRLTLLSPMALESIGVEGEDTRRKVVAAFAGKRTAVMLQAFGALGKPASTKRQRRDDDDELLSRAWGNVAGPSTDRSDQVTFTFNEVLDESELGGRYAFVNRAPVMTAWATVVSERLGFERAEALSIAHCYVSHASTARGVSLGILPTSERVKVSNQTGPSQPHFELMGVKIPVIKVEESKWRGISGGEVVGPERAFNYIRKSMFQTLPLVVGALTLLADSYLQPTRLTGVKEEQETDLRFMKEEDGAKDAASSVAERELSVTPPSSQSGGLHGSTGEEYGPEALHRKAFHLYTLFRPETGGQWGKRARFELDKVLALRKGHECDWSAWQERKRDELKKEDENSESAQLKVDVQRLIEEQGEVSSVVKTKTKSD